jgi:hypothetical protein
MCVSFCDYAVLKRGEGKYFMCLSSQVSVSLKLFQKNNETLSFESAGNYGMVEFEANNDIHFSITPLVVI